MSLKPKTLFEFLLRSYVRSRALSAPSVDAYVMFTVVGPNGGIWTFDLRKKGVHDVLAGKVKDPGLHIMLAEDFLDEFVSGKFDMAQALKNNKLGIVGEQRVYKGFSAFLTGKTAATGAAKTDAGLATPKAVKPPKASKSARPKKSAERARRR